ncbi:hypothetical protein CYMTET_12477, partial [Cymbomonas tetramitiformis]
AWIINASIRDNILMGKPLDEALYRKALEVCCLGRDLKQMPAGDMTEIGEKGVNLSGGQRQRVSMARAVCSETDVYLLDDPLSALDARVAKQIFKKCISEHMRSSTVIFVTNRVEFVHSTDRIVVLEGGRVAGQGDYTTLLSESPAFRSIMSEQSASEGSSRGAETEEELVEEEDELYDVDLGGAQSGKDAKNAALIQKEEREEGSVNTKVIRGYIGAMGGTVVFGAIALMYVLVQCLRVLGTVWLGWWSEERLGSGYSVVFYLLVYTAIGVSEQVISLCNQFTVGFGGVWAAEELHSGMLGRLLYAPMQFYNSTPIGRVLNRFSKDMSDVDQNLVTMVTLFVRGMLQLFSALVVIGIGTYYTLAGFVPMMCGFYWTWRYFQETSRELKRMDSVARSPLYAHFSQCMGAGLVSIRSFGLESYMAGILANRMDAQVRFNLMLFSANRWLGIRLETLGGLMILACAVMAVVGKDVLSAATTGLVLTYALQITSLLNMCVRVASMAENSLNSVERIFAYGDVDVEEPRVASGEIKVITPPSDWPSTGHIQFDNVVATYRADLPPVLNGLSFTVAEREKVGIVGRTGAGKSSLLLTLFRIMELRSGRISIDSVDISKLSLHTLRSRLSIIPQEPVLFMGTI